MQIPMSEERFVARYMADQAARKAAKEDSREDCEISAEAMRMLSAMEKKLGADYQGVCYEAEKHRRMRNSNAKRKLRRSQRKR